MDEPLLWLLASGLLIGLFLGRASLQQGRLNYDLNEYLLMDRRLSAGKFLLAGSLVGLWGPLLLPQIGLLSRSGLSYGFLALAAILIPLLAAFTSNRAALIARIFNEATPAQLLGAYYRSPGLRRLVALAALMVTLCLLTLYLSLALQLVAPLLPERLAGPDESGSILPRLAIAGPFAGLLWLHAASGGLGGVLKGAVLTPLLLVLALLAAAIVTVQAIGGWGSFLALLTELEASRMSEQLFKAGEFYNPLPTAAPTNMAWPGLMVLSALLASAGIATSPFFQMTGFTASASRSHGHLHFLGMAVLAGIVLLTLVLILAHLPRLAAALPPTPGLRELAIDPVDTTGREVFGLLALIQQTPLGAAWLIGPLAAILLLGLFSAAAANLFTGAATLAHDLLPCGRGGSTNLRLRIRTVMLLLLLAALALSLWQPGDALTLALLAGAFGLQLLPAFQGLCHASSLTREAVVAGLVGGLVGVLLTSRPLASLLDIANAALPFGPWPHSLHPAFWGLLANLALLLPVQLVQTLRGRSRAFLQQDFAHRQRYHRRPDGAPLTPPNIARWRSLAWLLALVFGALVLAPLAGFGHLPGFLKPLPALWLWQLLAWMVGVPLVYIAAYHLQPAFSTNELTAHGVDDDKWRYRIKAPSRKLPNSEPGTALVPASDRNVLPKPDAPSSPTEPS